MWQSLTITFILVLCLFFIGRKIHRQFKIATDPRNKTGCGCGCSGCSLPSCPPGNQIKKRSNP
jgi:hypothetical protein